MSVNINWYINRLKCMSIPEVAYRVKKTSYIKLQKSGFFRVPEPPKPTINHDVSFFIQKPEINSKSYCDEAEDIIRGYFNIFSYEKCDLGVPPIWNKDYSSGITGSLIFGKSLDYRNNELVGDIKYLWEPNRHLQLVRIAQAYMLTRDEVYLKRIKILLDSWIDQCPYLMGANWTSSLELGIRLINWSLVWQMIGGYHSVLFEDEDGKIFRERWLRSIYQHAHFIKGHLSGYSSANNHLIGEVSGLFIATIIWPYWKEFSVWQNKAKKILEREAELQNSSDGVNLEQAVSYQQFVLDFLLLPMLAGEHNGQCFSGGYKNKIEKMLVFLASIMDVKGNLPMIGDADDGYVVNLSAENEWCPYRSLLATGSILYKRNDFKFKSKKLDDKTKWLLGPEADKSYAKIKTSQCRLPIETSFPDGGYYLIGQDYETKNELRMVMDAGPLGYQGIAAHGHADALSVYLSVSGSEFLIDPGTYAYHTQKKWRDYFRGTSAHNTIRIDQQDQSVSGGNFMWLDKAAATCELYEAGDEQNRIIASHDGYQRLDDPVTHTREVILDCDSRQYTITDHINCLRHHQVEQFWHFAEDCNVILDSRKLTVTNNGIIIRISFDNQTDLTISMHTGEEKPPLGWVSRRYDYKSPATCVKVSLNIDVSTSLRTVIQCL